MADNFISHSAGLDSPASKAFAITPSDSTDLPDVTRGLYTGTGGTIVLILTDDASAVTLNSVPAGTVLPLRVRRVLATGTTASMNLIGLQ